MPGPLKGVLWVHTWKEFVLGGWLGRVVGGTYPSTIMLVVTTPPPHHTESWNGVIAPIKCDSPTIEILCHINNRVAELYVQVVGTMFGLVMEHGC